ncbi:MAG: hypothetical protein IJB24_02015 [Clostridia bacterium]|nr:hypothetical protein [Clostridia bacterium]
MKKAKIRDIDLGRTPELEVHPEAPVNEYYIDIANKFKTAKFIVIILLVVFMLFMISVFRSDVTLENFKYLVRFFSSANTVYSGGYENIYYDTTGVMDVDVFNGDLVTVKNDSVDLYDMNGSNVASYDISQITPTVVSRGKYMLVYDLGGNNAQLFNNFSQLTAQTYDYPISCAAVSGEGMHAVVTKSLDYQSVIHLYDHNFNLISKIYKDKYITDIRIDSSGKKLVCTSVLAEGGRYTSEVMTYEPYTDKEESKLALPGSFAVRCGFFSDGGYAALADTALLFFDKDNNQTESYPLTGIVPTDCLILDDYAVLCYNENIVGSQSRVLVFSTKGEILMDTTVDDKILDTASYMENLYILTDGKITSLNMQTGEQLSAKVEGSATGVYMCDKNSIVIDYSNMAKALKTAEIFTEEEGNK